MDLQTAASNRLAAVEAENALITERNTAQASLVAAQAALDDATSKLAAAEAASAQALAELDTAALGGTVPLQP